ncbi:MAG: hypothetical protein ABWY06_23445 [Pseudomonas sp.]|uniref:hypothetical protein n=1 Tax=Pseudomonas sp. TaxID=306 RepID=UPI003399B938
MRWLSLAAAWVSWPIQAAPAGLVGDWLCVDDLFEQRLSLRGDGSYTNTPSMMGQVVLEEQGTWTFADERLVLRKTQETQRGVTERQSHRLQRQITERTPDAFTASHENGSGSLQVSRCTRP